jgi:hypothetical protein
VPLHPTLTYIKSKDSVRMPNKACEYFVFKSRVGKLWGFVVSVSTLELLM